MTETGTSSGSTVPIPPSVIDSDGQDESELAVNSKMVANRIKIALSLVEYNNVLLGRAPIIISILGLGLLVMLGGTAAAPFIYTLF